MSAGASPAVDLLVVRGAPGVGKTTAVQLLRWGLASGAVIEVDGLRAQVVDWRDEPHHALVVGLARQLALAYLAAGVAPVVIVDSLWGDKTSILLGGVECPHRIASIYATEQTITDRLAARGDGYTSTDDALAVNREIQASRFPHEHCMDTTHATPADVAAWLARLVTEGDHEIVSSRS